MSGVSQTSVVGVEMVPALSVARRRWRTAYTTLYSTKALMSLTTRELAAPAQLRTLLRSPSHTVVTVDPEGFSSNPKALHEIALIKDLEQLLQMGGVEGVARALKTDAQMGIQGHIQDLASRRQAFGSNIYQRPPPKTWKILLETLKDPIIIILLLCAALSLGFGIKKHGPEGVSDGACIFVAVFLVMSVTAFSNIWPRRQFYKVSRSRDDIKIEVIRDGQLQHLSISEAVVGDVVCLKAGNQVPADGLFLFGDSLKMDESNITENTDPIEVNPDQNPFLLSGTMVTNGSARMVVTAVGSNTEWGKMSNTKHSDSTERTPLHTMLHELTLKISVAGLLVAFLALLVLVIRYFSGHMHDENGFYIFAAGKTSSSHVYDAIVGIFATPIAIAAASIPEGLLLAVTITIAYSIKRMDAEGAIVRNLSACEALGAVTVVCTNKIGSMKIYCPEVQFWLGEKTIGKGELLSSSTIAPELVEMLREGIALNSSMDQLEDASAGHYLTEKAIFDWCVSETGIDVMKLREKYVVLEVESSPLETGERSLLIQKTVDNTVHLHKRGAPMKILSECSNCYAEDGLSRQISNSAREKLEQIIQKMEASCFHCVAFAHRRMSTSETESHSGESEDFEGKQEQEPLNLLGFVELRVKCRPEAKKTLRDFQLAGVDIKMFTKEHLPFARAAAVDCGITKPNQDTVPGEVVDGEDFRNYDDNERLAKVDRIRVVARATTFDKPLMVQSLKQKGHVVAVTGDNVEDTRALREADVGICLGSGGADIAKANSDIIILDDNFASVARVLRWGRGLYSNIQTFTQFQLTASIVSLVIDFVTAVSASAPPTINIVTAISVGKVPYATLQVLWVKLIVGTLAAVALTIEQPTEELMQQPPVDRREPLVTSIMWRDIVVHALYQITVLLTIQFKGKSTFNLNAKEKDTIIFNIIVCCQIFMIFNTKKSAKSIFKELHRRRLFWAIIGTITLLQVVIIEILKRFANTARLNWQQWAACIGVGSLSWPINWLVRSINIPWKSLFSSEGLQNINSSHID